jgi:hypothetical protein
MAGPVHTTIISQPFLSTAPEHDITAGPELLPTKDNQ